MNLASAILIDALWSAVAAGGFAILFNVPPRALPYCVVVGGLGHALRALLLHWGMSIVPATLFGATSIGFLARACAHRLQMPSLIFAVSGSIPMVPGVFAYSTMIGLLKLTGTSSAEAAVPLLVEVANDGIHTALILGALAIGNVAPALLFDRPKPVV